MSSLNDNIINPINDINNLDLSDVSDSSDASDASATSDGSDDLISISSEINNKNNFDNELLIKKSQDTNISQHKFTPQYKYTKTYKHIKKIIKKYIQKIEAISSKKNKIKTVIEEISKNKKLYFKEHVDNLNFQIELLNNETHYLKNIAYAFINKYLNDLIVNGQHIIFLLTSLLNYNINENKNEILSKIKKIDITIDTTKSLADILTQIEIVISNTNNNITLINEFNKEYDEFIFKLTNKFSNENLHCSNLSTSYTFKKKQFDLEYDKNIETLSNIHDYFKTLSNSLNDQISKTMICNFCLEK
jgi:hypothetical protein